MIIEWIHWLDGNYDLNFCFMGFLEGNQVVEEDDDN